MNTEKYAFQYSRSFTALLLCFAFLSFTAFFCSCKAEKKAPVPQKGKLVLKTVPEGAQITLAGTVQKKVTPAEYMVPPGVYVVKLSKEGFRTRWQRAEVKIGQTSRVEAELTPVTASLLVTAKAGNKYGVSVSCNGKKMGETPLVLRDLPIGKGEIILSKPGYSLRRVTFEIEDSLPPSPVAVELASNRGTLKVDSFPADAEVFLNGKLSGNTPLTDDFEEGRYSVEIRKSGYYPQIKNVNVKRNSSLDLGKIRLRPLPALLTVNSVPAGAKIYINDVYRGNTPGNPVSLAPGKYKVKVEKENYDCEEETIVLSGGEKKILNMNLDTVMGTLEIVTRPAGVSVYVDGKFIGRSKADPANPRYSEVIRVPNIRQGEHTVKISHKRARRPPGGSLTKVVTVKKGETVRVDQIELWVPDIKIIRTNDKVIEGRFLRYMEDGGVYCEISPGINYGYKKEWIKRTEKLPLEDE